MQRINEEISYTTVKEFLRMIDVSEEIQIWLHLFFLILPKIIKSLKKGFADFSKKNFKAIFRNVFSMILVTDLLTGNENNSRRTYHFQNFDRLKCVSRDLIRLH